MYIITRKQDGYIVFTDELNFLKNYITNEIKTDYIEKITTTTTEKCRVYEYDKKVFIGLFEPPLSTEKIPKKEFKSSFNIKEMALLNLYLLNFLQPKFYSQDKSFMKACLHTNPTTLLFFDQFLEEDEKAATIKILQDSYRKLVEMIDFIDSQKRKQSAILKDRHAADTLEICYNNLFEEEKEKSHPHNFLYYFCKIKSKIKFESDYKIMCSFDYMWLVKEGISKIYNALKFGRFAV